MTEPALGPRITEISGGPTPKSDPTLVPRVVETDDTRPIEIAEPVLPATPSIPLLQPRRKLGPAGIACAGGGVLVGGVLAIDAISWVSAQFLHSIFLGLLSVAVITAGLGGICYWLTTEVQALKKLRAVDRHRIEWEEMDALPASEVEWHITGIINAVRPLGTEEFIAKFRDLAQQHHSTPQRMELLSRIVLRPLDERALTSIRRAVVSTMGMSAVIPSALGDTLIFVVRGIRLIKAIAEIYGHRPGAAGTVHLFKRLLLGTGTVGAADFAGNTLGGLVAQHLGGGVMEKVGEKVGTITAESVLAGQRMARIGVFTMKACRPIAFGHGEEPSIMKLVLG